MIQAAIYSSHAHWLADLQAKQSQGTVQIKINKIRGSDIQFPISCSECLNLKAQEDNGKRHVVQKQMLIVYKNYLVNA